jgi:hypothetical protein
MLLSAENLIIFGNNNQRKKEVKNLADCIGNIFGNKERGNMKENWIKVEWKYYCIESKKAVFLKYCLL